MAIWLDCCMMVTTIFGHPLVSMEMYRDTSPRDGGGICTPLAGEDACSLTPCAVDDAEAAPSLHECIAVFLVNNRGNTAEKQ